MEDKEKTKKRVIFVVGIISVLILIAYLFGSVLKDSGEYNYCIEWERVDEEGFREGVFHRNNLIYTCYNLATLEFKCDYDIDDQQVLMVKPIVNTTKEDGLLTSITYGEPNYFNCIRWLKSKNG